MDDAFDPLKPRALDRPTAVPLESRVLLDRGGVVAGSVEVTVVKTGVRAEPGADFTVDGPAGTLLRNPRGSLEVGAAVTVRYIALPISRVSDEAGAKALSMLLPNTAVPPPRWSMR